MNEHLILIGFKHVGKSAVGKALAQKIGKQFFDLDEEIEKSFFTQNQEKLTCRQIMQTKGADFFRNLEAQVLQQILKEKPSVIALGGGTPMRAENQSLIAKHKIILIDSPKGIVFERIMVNGRPAFFSPDEAPLDSFNKLWEERDKVFQSLSKIKISNIGTPEETALSIVNQI